MAVDLRKFFRATNPDKALAVDNPEDKKYYIDFSSVRGGAIIKKLRTYASTLYVAVVN